MRILLAIISLSLPLWPSAQFDNLIQVPVNQDRFIIQFDNCGWLDTPDSVNVRGYSLGFTAHIMREYAFGEYGTFPLSLAWGYGISAHNIHSDAAFVTDTINGQSQSILTPFPDSYSYDKNKLAVSYIELPVELRLRTGRKKRVAAWKSKADVERMIGPQFKLYIGAKLGYAINIHGKTRDDDGKRKIFGVDHLDPWRLGLTTRVGFGAFTLTGFYSLRPLIEEGRGTQVIPYSVGLSILLL